MTDEGSSGHLQLLINQVFHKGLNLSELLSVKGKTLRYNYSDYSTQRKHSHTRN